MRPAVTSHGAWYLSVLLAGLAPLVGWASPPAASSPPAVGASASISLSDDPDACLEQALDQERLRNWSAALDLYQRALDRWPGRSEERR